MQTGIIGKNMGIPVAQFTLENMHETKSHACTLTNIIFLNLVGLT